jgi:phage baseplate assembly protein W
LVSKTDIASMSDLTAALDAITDLFSAITFDEDKIPTDYPNEYLIKLEGVKYYTVAPDDTLQSIALDQLGSADKWREIAAINDIIIENPAKIYLPISTITYTGDLAAGSNGIPYAGDWDSESVIVGSLIAIEDSLGMKQKLVVKSVDPTTVEHKDEPARVYTQETFSQYFHGPITITRYDNRAAYGTYDTTTTLAQASSYGTKKLYVDSAKDIFKGYLLCIVESDLSYFYTVVDVDYINCVLTVAETNQNHAANRTVEIYDTYNRLTHLEEGTVLKIPRPSGNEATGNVVQSYTEIFGTDLEIDGNGFLTTSDGDLATLSGLPNFKQAISQRISCPYKDLIFHPEYGCGLWNIIGEKNTPYWETAAKATIIDALSHEPRIRQLARFSMATTHDSIRFDIIVNPVDQNTPSDLNFVVTT